MNAHTQPLFRSEVLEARRQRVEGDVILAQPRHTHVLVFLIFALVVGLGLWLAAGRYARTEVAKGLLVTDVPSAKIMAIRPGQVTSLFVRDGDHVRAGQQIAIIRTEQANEGGGSAIGEGLAAIGNQKIIAQQQQQLARQRAQSDRARLMASLSGFARQKSELEGQIAIQEQLAASSGEMLKRVLALVDHGFISKIEVEQRRQVYLSAKQELSRLHQQVASMNADADQARAELSHTAAQGDSEVAAARSSAETLVQQAAQLQGQRAYTIVAPISGHITALQTGIGRTAEANLPLMEIVPDGSPLHVEVYAPTRAIGFVRPGQEVRLLYDAFPYQRFGSFEGRIARVSRAVIDPRDVAAPLEIKEPVYRIEVTPSAQTVRAFGDRLPLQPGMTLTADLILDRRSFFDWLLEPLNAVMRRNG